MIYTIHNGLNYSDSTYWFVDLSEYTEKERQLMVSPKEDSYYVPRVVQIMTEGEFLGKIADPAVMFFHLHEFADWEQEVDRDGAKKPTLKPWVKNFPKELMRKLYCKYLSETIHARRRVWFKAELEQWLDDAESQ